MTPTTKLLQQGAEATIYLVSPLSKKFSHKSKSSRSALTKFGAKQSIPSKGRASKFIIKDRISKSYRHPELDKKIRKQRTRSETKLLIKANQIVNSPLPLTNKLGRADGARGGGTPLSKIKMPFIDGKKLSEHLDKFQLKKQKQIMRLIGTSVTKLHKADIIHGDLTTSNMIFVGDNKSVTEGPLIEKSSKALTKSQQRSLTKSASEQNKSASKASVFFIDFGLGFISKKIEDKAVDIHLLKQALEAKHFKNWKTLFREFEKSYSKNNPESKKIFERIKAVEKRGRYRH